jgi:hypothetical protein
MLYQQADRESIRQTCRQGLVSLVLTDKCVLADPWKLDPTNMQVSPSITISHRQDLDIQDPPVTYL